VLVSVAFKQSDADPCLYTRSEKGGALTMVVVWVDDTLVVTKDKHLAADFKAALEHEFELSSGGDVAYFLGLEVVRDRAAHKLFVTQHKYVRDIVNDYGLDHAKPVKTPQVLGLKLSRTMSPATDAAKADMEHVPYRNLVGALLYAAHATRPDICAAVGEVARFMDNPGRDHWEAAKRIVRYLKDTASVGVCFGADSASATRIVGYSDADYNGDVDTRRSTTGFVFLLAGGPISWSSKRQVTVALSTMEAEYMALCAAAQEARWLTRLLAAMGQGEQREAVLIYEDNQSCIAFTKDPTNHTRAKHIDTKYHFVREQVEFGNIVIKYCDTKHMIADVLTKAIAAPQFAKLIALMGLRSFTAKTA
jgi:hypothetical protein